MNLQTSTGGFMKFIAVLAVLFSLSAEAATQHISFSTKDMVVQKDKSRSEGFSKMELPNITFSRQLGTPELPVKSFLLAGTPENITVSVQVNASQRLNGFKPMPVQQQPCRCADDRKLTFQFNTRSYSQPTPQYTLSYLGAFRGTPVTRLDVNLAQYNARDNSVTLATDVSVDHSVPLYRQETEEYTDYLIVAPAGLVKGTEDFVAWKKSQGYNVIVETLQTPQITKQALTDAMAKHYKDSGTDFVILIGDEKGLPMNTASTSGGSTPSDLKYFTMDGPQDTIPDMFAGRIAASTPDDVRDRLAKIIEFEQKAHKDTKGLTRVIGIASNEGYGPSDNDYIKSIEDKFVQTWNFQSTHFYQNDKKSNPTELNKELSTGAAWLFYMGHGSGSSWPSMYQDYEVDDARNIVNNEKVKPIIIDVACMNGKLLPGYLGTTFDDVLSPSAFGAVAYYGGTVNISWHPPAVMARGIAYEHTAKNFRHLGEALLAGQMYLTANWNSTSDVVDNFEWYHLQGDPGMIIQH